MWYIMIFDAKEETTLKEIENEREEWIKEGRDKVFQQRCKTIYRYEVIGLSPLRVIFVIDTDDPSALNLISRHFGDRWDSITYPVIQRGIYEALEEDRTIIGG
jgi:hypothetical protein